MKEKVFDASKMRELRKERGLTQSKLAKLSGLSLSAIQGYEQGRYEPKFDAIDRISRALGSSFRELYDPGALSKSQNIKRARTEPSGALFFCHGSGA